MAVLFIEPLLDTLGPLLLRREDEDVAATATNASIARLDERIAAQIDALALNDGAQLAAYGDEHALAVVATWVGSAAVADHRRAWEILLAADMVGANSLIDVVLRHGGPAWRQFAASHAHLLGVMCGGLSPQMTWLGHPAPVVRRWTWRHAVPGWPISDAHLSLALADASTEAVCVAALCKRHDPRLPAVLHGNLPWAARLATAEDAAAVAGYLWAAPGMLADLGWLGRPMDVAPLIACLTHAEAHTALAAATAFTYLTGVDIAGARRIRLPSADDDAADVRLPDAQRAQRAWQAQQPQLGAAQRIAGGLEVIDPQHPDLPRAARRDLLLRRCRAG